MKRPLLIFLVFLLPLVAKSQTFPSEVWHEGKVALLEEDMVEGLVKYDLENNLVQVNVGNTIQTYSGRKILFFEIFDEAIGAYRTFYALPYQVQSNYETPVLFEVVYEGDLTLLCREYIEQENIPQMGYYSRNNMYTRLRLDFHYYFLNEEGKITQYSLKKKDLLDIMKRHAPEVKQFMKKYRLRYDRREDLARVTAYFNELMGS